MMLFINPTVYRCYDSMLADIERMDREIERQSKLRREEAIRKKWIPKRLELLANHYGRSSKK